MKGKRLQWCVVHVTVCVLLIASMVTVTTCQGTLSEKLFTCEKDLSLTKIQLEIQSARLSNCQEHCKTMKLLLEVRNKAAARAVSRFSDLSYHKMNGKTCNRLVHRRQSAG